MLKAYRDHVAERAALGIPPLALDAKQRLHGATEISEGLSLGTYAFDHYKARPADKRLERVTVVSPGGQKITSGGSSDRAANDWQAKPTGASSAPSVVMMVTPVQNCPSTVRNCLLSMTCVVAASSTITSFPP